MFLQACVKNSVHGGWGVSQHAIGQTSPWADAPNERQTTPRLNPTEHYGIRSTSGWYASYLNAFLFYDLKRKTISEIEAAFVVWPLYSPTRSHAVRLTYGKFSRRHVPYMYHIVPTSSKKLALSILEKIQK